MYWPFFELQECGFGISLMSRIFDDIHADVIVAAAGVYRSPEIAASNNCAFDKFGATSRDAKEMTRKRTEKESHSRRDLVIAISGANG